MAVKRAVETPVVTFLITNFQGATPVKAILILAFPPGQIVVFPLIEVVTAFLGVKVIDADCEQPFGVPEIAV